MKIIYTVKEVRKSKNLTQLELSEISGVGMSTISELENNKKDPTFPTLLLLALAMNVDIKELYKIVR